MQKKLLLILLVLLITGVIIVISWLERSAYRNNDLVNKRGGEELTLTFQVEQVITVNDNKDTQTIEVEHKKTVLDLLLRTKQVEVKEYSFGKSVEAIEGVKNGNDGKYWIYYVNGQQAQVGADQYQLKDGDKVEWRFEKGQ